MHSTRSTTSGESNDVGETVQEFAQSEDATTRRRANIRMVQNVLLIWLDNNIDDSNTHCQQAISKLYDVVNTINTFTDIEECVKFISNMSHKKAYIVIGDSFGQQIVPRIHNISQVDTIFIFSGDKRQHEQWTKEWSKIKGIYTEISSIYDAFKQTTDQYEHNATPISFMVTAGILSNKSLDQLDCSFMYTQITADAEFLLSRIQNFINTIF